jgi:FkbM family methyltransferase
VFRALLNRCTASKGIKRWLIPLLRAYIRYVPLQAGKRSLWSRLVNPYLAWESHRFVARTRFGSRLAGDTQEIIQQYIYYFGLWEPYITRWIESRLAPGDTFIDVGANIGYYSLLASRRVGPRGRVVAIEPSPALFRALQQNLARNRARNVRAVNVAVSDCRGRARLFRGPESNKGLTTLVEEMAVREECTFECEVETAPLSALLYPEEAASARLIKIDVEGAEWPVVSTLQPLLAGGRPDLEITVEVCPERLAQQHTRPEDLLKIFADGGFKAYRLENDYKAESYVGPLPHKRPVRLTGPVDAEVDLLFSRQDAEML